MTATGEGAAGSQRPVHQDRQTKTTLNHLISTSWKAYRQGRGSWRFWVCVAKVRGPLAWEDLTEAVVPVGWPVACPGDWILGALLPQTPGFPQLRILHTISQTVLQEVPPKQDEGDETQIVTSPNSSSPNIFLKVGKQPLCESKPSPAHSGYGEEEEEEKDDKRVGEKREKHENKAPYFIKNEGV